MERGGRGGGEGGEVAAVCSGHTRALVWVKEHRVGGRTVGCCSGLEE